MSEETSFITSRNRFGVDCSRSFRGFCMGDSNVKDDSRNFIRDI